MDTLLSRSRQPARSASGLSALDTNMDSLLCNLSSSFNPLHRDCLLDYQVQAVNTGHVCMSVVMPNEMLRSFSTLLESMGGFFRIVNNKARSSSATIKAHDLDELERQSQFKSAFHSEVCSMFDSFISQGHVMKDAVKRTNFAMKAKKHPWASFYIIEKTLRSEGRLLSAKRIKNE